MGLIPSISTRLDDPDIERARRNLDERVTELQRLPMASAVVLGPIELEDGIATSVAHNLNRIPKWVGPSCVRGAVSAGCIVETRDGSKNSITLTATGYGATITVDLVVL